MADRFGIAIDTMGLLVEKTVEAVAVARQVLGAESFTAA